MITIYIGKSASGKDTFLRRAVAAGAKPIVSYTTRPIREGERDGVDYNFVSIAQFEELERTGEIIESRFYDTSVAGKQERWYYGSPKVDPTKDEYVVVLDVAGAMYYIEQYGSQNLNICLLIVPNDIREERAKKRGSFDQTEWDRRLKDDELKFSDEAIASLEKKYGRQVWKINNTKGEEQ